MARDLALLAAAIVAAALLCAMPTLAQTSTATPTTTSSSSSMTTHSDPGPASTPSPGTGDSGQYAGMVEVVPGSIALSIGRPQPGDEVTVYVRIRNTTGSTLQADCDITIASLDGNGGDTNGFRHQEVSLGPHAERVVDHTWEAPSEGRYEVHVTAKHVRAGSGAPATFRFSVGGSASSPQLLLTTGLTNIGNVERGQERTIPVDVTAYGADYADVQLQVLEAGGLAVQVLTPPTDVPAGETIRFFLRVGAETQQNASAAESRRILLQATTAEGSSNVESINVVLHERDFLGIPWLTPPVALGAAGAGAALAATFRRHA